MRSNENLIAELTGDLRPVAPMTLTRGLTVVLAAASLSIAAVAGFAGIWDGPFIGTATIFFYLANGLLAVFGFAGATNGGQEFGRDRLGNFEHRVVGGDAGSHFAVGRCGGRFS